MTLKKGYKKLVEEAMADIETITVEEGLKLQGDEDVTFFDIRDVRELERTGTIPGAVHTPRGMLEFWVDPESPYYKDVFGTGKKLVLLCAGGQTADRYGCAPRLPYGWWLRRLDGSRWTG